MAPSYDHSVDENSRYAKIVPEVKMHGANSFPGLAMSQRKEARRLTTKSQQKWMDAVERGEMVRVKQLLEDGQDINEVCEPGGSSGLYVASRTNNVRMAEMLLKAGADPAVMTTDFVSPAWIAISRGFDEMVKLLLDPAWNAKLVAYLKEETVETLTKNPECGVQQTHYDLANTRRYWKCVHHLEHALGVPPEKSRIPEIFWQPADGWAMGLAPSEPGQRPDMPMHYFYWKAFTKEKCQTEPPEGSKKLVHVGGGVFEERGGK